jgi:hypothetical protein
MSFMPWWQTADRSVNADTRYRSAGTNPRTTGMIDGRTQYRLAPAKQILIGVRDFIKAASRLSNRCGPPTKLKAGKKSDVGPPHLP